MQNTNGACLAMTVAALFVAACEQKTTTPSAEGATKASAGETAETAKSAPAAGSAMPAPPAPGSGNVQCLGIHECKGKSACHVIGSHACAGENSCKGKGWISVPAAECQAKGGKVLDS
jgi:hypothetical protein